MSSRFLKAIALEYSLDTEDPPLVSASGEREQADMIVRLARIYGVPVIERPETARALQLLEIGESIPEALFRAVATIINEVDLILTSHSAARRTTR